MTYTIRIGNDDIYYPGDRVCAVSSAVFKEEAGSAGSLEITVPPTNPHAGRISVRNTELSLYGDGELLFNGEVRETGRDFFKNMTVYAVGELAYLGDSVQTLRKLEGTRSQVFASLISSHNSQVEERKRFTAGTVYGGQASATLVTEYETTMSALQNLADGDLLRVRRQGGVRYLDIMPLESYGRRSEQYIEFSRNITDYTDGAGSDELATACVPLGASLDESPVEDCTAYLDIKSVNGGLDYVYSPEAVANFGWIRKIVHFNVLDTPEALKTAGENWLSQNQFEKWSYEITAVDLPGEDGYRAGDYVRCISAPHGMDAWLPVRTRSTDLLDPSNNRITVGAEGVKTFTAQSAGALEELKRGISDMPGRADILREAQRNASAMINANGDKGYVVLRQNDEGKLYEILIMDAPSIEQSTQAWRWNLSGFGHGKKAAGASEFTWEADVAITMDGSIVADYITSGVIRGLEIIGCTFRNDDDSFHVSTDGTIRGGDIISNRTDTGTTTPTYYFKSDNGDIKCSAVMSDSVVYCTGVRPTAGCYIENSKSKTVGLKDDRKVGQLAVNKGEARLTITNIARENGGIVIGVYGGKIVNMDGAYVGQDGTNAQWSTICSNNSDSDIRLKCDIKAIPREYSRDLIMGMKPKSFKYKEGDGHTKYGMIAQQLKRLVDEIKPDGDNNNMVLEDDEAWSISYVQLIPHIVNYLQGLEERLNDKH